MRYPLVSILVLNWNRGPDTIACLESLRNLDYPNFRMLVVDNGSNDNSVERIKEACPEVPILEIGANLGYAGGNNAGIRSILNHCPEWIFIINDDLLLTSDTLSRMIEIVDTDPKIGIAGPTVYHYSEPAIIQSAGGRLDRYWQPNHIGQNEKDIGQYSQPQQVDWITGCAFLVRRETIEQVGLLDEQFFCYWEDVEWCLRARNKGWKVVFIPQAKAWHKGVQRNYQPSPAVTYYITRNWFMLLRKHHAPFLAWVYVAGMILRTLVGWTLKPRRHEILKHRNAMWLGALDYLRQRWGPMLP